MKLRLPSGRRVELTAADGVPFPVPAHPGAKILFDDARVLFEGGGVAITSAGAPIALADLALVDFHALRAVAVQRGWLAEEAVRVPCANCEHEVTLVPSAAMPLGPFVEGALDDDELDARAPEGEPLAIRPIDLGGGRLATSVTLSDVTVAAARPLHEALARDALALDARVVAAMGIVALGDERDAARIATALEEADDDAFASLTDRFIERHYPLRLFGLAKCDACGARIDVDAPADREFGYEGVAVEDVDEAVSAPEPEVLGEPPEHPRRGHERSGAHTIPPGRSRVPFVSFDAFDARAHEAFEALAPKTLADQIAFVVEGGVPAVDDGGIPLLGAYLPGSPGGGGAPSRPHEITVYYRTFRAEWEDAAAAGETFAWEAELEETIEHELEHFLAELRGYDATDEEERRAIDLEAERLHGKRTLLAQEVSGLGKDFSGFLRTSWPIWLIVVVVALLVSWAESR